MYSQLHDGRYIIAIGFDKIFMFVSNNIDERIQ